MEPQGHSEPRTGEAADPRAWRLMQAVVLGGLGLILGLAPADFERKEPAPILRVDPNTAPAGVLACLPRLGPTRVAALLAARRQQPFDSPGDLEHRVKGIGPATLAVLRPHLRFEP